MREYVTANPCDPVRANALSALDANPNNGLARSILDYFLYSVCEQCCDCVPMGASRDHALYASQHTTDSPTLYTAERGNCPAHAFYDICKILPNVTHFTAIDAPVTWAPPACEMLEAWFGSSASRNWQENPSTTLTKPLKSFLLGMLDMAKCGDKEVWEQCWDLEASQNHLGVISIQPEPIVEMSVEPMPSVEVVADVTTMVVDVTPTVVVGTPTVADGTPTVAIAPAVPPQGIDAIGPEEAPVKAPEVDAPRTVNAAGIEKPSGERTCFPAHATVELRDGSMVRMDKLNIGDMVRTDVHEFSPVIMFTHRDANARTRLVHLLLADGKSIALSNGHYLPVNGKLTAARDVLIGDYLQVDASVVGVVHVSELVASGLYNPQTAAGSIVVNGITCSTYTETIRASTAHAMLAPVRALFFMGGVTESTVGGVLRYGAERIW